MCIMNMPATRAKQRWGDFVSAAMSGKRVNITQHGVPRIAVVTAERMDELERTEKIARALIADAAEERGDDMRAIE